LVDSVSFSQYWFSSNQVDIKREASWWWMRILKKTSADDVYACMIVQNFNPNEKEIHRTSLVYYVMLM
jgi:hypothetical protein